MGKTTTISPLRQRMIEDMTARNLGHHAQRSHIPGVATATMTSGSSASNSRAYVRKLSGRPAQRVSTRTLRPAAQPNLSSPLREHGNADPSFCIARGHIHEHADAPRPLRLLRPCTNGHATAPPRSVMNSRRLMHPLRSTPMPEYQIVGAPAVKQFCITTPPLRRGLLRGHLQTSRRP
jgi:hypothetical protein